MLISGALLAAAWGVAGFGKTEPQVLTISALPYYGDAFFTPHWLTPDNDTLRQFHRISPFSLTNQEGDILTERDLEQKIYVVNFFFTACPGICPKMTENMHLIQDAFAEDRGVLILSHSVTPERDSVPVLQQYAITNGVQSGKWHLLTGDRELIYKLGRQDYFVEEDLGLEKDSDEFLHTENFVLVDKDRHIRGIYNGLNRTSVNELITDIRTLQME